MDGKNALETEIIVYYFGIAISCAFICRMLLAKRVFTFYSTFFSSHEHLLCEHIWRVRVGSFITNAFTICDLQTRTPEKQHLNIFVVSYVYNKNSVVMQKNGASTFLLL